MIIRVRMKGILLVLICFIIQLTISGCYLNKNVNEDVKPAILFDSNVKDIANIGYNQANLTNTLSKYVYGFKYKNMTNLKINTSLELYVKGSLIKNISKDTANINESIKDGHIGLEFVRPLQIDKKLYIQWAMEHNDNITFWSYDDFSFKTNMYSIEIDKEIYPARGESYSLITYYADPNNTNIGNTYPEKNSKELEKFYTQNYNYVFFFKIKVT